MDVILVDTSVWVNFFRAQETASTLFLKNNRDSVTIATCPVVVQEILQGIINDKEYKSIGLYFDSLLKLQGSHYLLAKDAANLYRQIRKRGYTIRKPNDCLIACYAIRNDVKVLHDDKDFSFIAACSELKIQSV